MLTKLTVLRDILPGEPTQTQFYRPSNAAAKPTIGKAGIEVAQVSRLLVMVVVDVWMLQLFGPPVNNKFLAVSNWQVIPHISSARAGAGA